MATLIEWNSPVIDPGLTSSQTPTDEKQVWVHRAVYDSPPTLEEVYANPRCPSFFTRLRPGSYMIVVEREARLVADAPQVCEVRITYANKWTNEQNGDKPGVTFQFVPDPNLRPALINGGTYTVREAVEQADEVDSTGGILSTNIPVTTTAGEPLILEEEYHRRMFTINKNVRELSDLIIQGGDYINEDVVKFNNSNTKFEKGTLWLWPIAFGHISVENGYYYFPITLTILYNEKTWYRKVRNAGYYMRDLNFHFKSDNNGGWSKFSPMVPIRYSNGQKPDRPVLLNREGQPIQLVVTGEIPDPQGFDENGNQTNPANPNPRIQIRKLKQYTIQSPEDFGRTFTKSELAQTKRYFRTFRYLKFNSLPIR